MSREDVIISQRVQPFITTDQKILKKCRKKNKHELAGTNIGEVVQRSDLLLTYFTMMEMDASGEWDDDEDLEAVKVSELSGLPIETVTRCLHVLDAMGVFK